MEMTKRNQTVREWLEERRKSVEDLSLQIIDQKQARIDELEEENKKLNKELELVRKNTRANVETLDNMYWENVDLKKENKELQRENDKLKIHIEAKDKAYMDLLADYNYLKARIKKTERAFIKYKEKLEKLEIDLDMVVMNR